MSDLHRKLARTQVALRAVPDHYESDSDDNPWPLGAWDPKNLVIRDRPRYPVLLRADSPVSSAYQLQQLAETGSLPETIETIQVEWDGTRIKGVTICHVSSEEKEKMEEERSEGEPTDEPKDEPEEGQRK